MLYVAWVVLHRNRHIGASERRQLIPHVRFQVPFLGPESQLKSGFACAGLLCMHGLRLMIKEDVLPLREQPDVLALTELAKRGLLAAATWHCKRPQISLKTSIDDQC